MMGIRSVLGLLFSVFIAQGVSAQSETTIVTDVRAELKTLLGGQVVTKQRTVREKKTRCYTTSCVVRTPATIFSLTPSGAETNRTLCRECDEFEVDRTENYSALPEVTSAQILSVASLDIKQAEIGSLPERLIVTTDELINCSKTAFSSQRTLSQSVQTGYSITVTKTVGTTNAMSANISAKLPGDVTVGGTASVSTQVTTANARQDSRSETVNQAQTVNVSVQPDTKVKLEFRTLVRKLRFPFLGKVVVDGPLDANISNVTKASDFLKDEKLRTFDLQGFITVDAASAGRVVTTEQKPTPLECAGSTPNEEIRIRSFTTTLETGAKSSLLSDKQVLPQARKVSEGGLLKSLSANQPLSYPGAWCNTQPCNLPLDGYRKVCYRDENLYCNDCRDEPDSVCASSELMPNSTDARKTK